MSRLPDPMSWFRSFDDYWFGHVPAWPLACFRIIFSLVLLAYFTDRILYLDEFLGNSIIRLPDLQMTETSMWGDIQPLYISPLSQTAVLISVALFYLAAIGLCVGFFSRSCAGALSLWCIFTMFYDYFGTFSIDKSSAFVLLFLAFSECGRTLSADAWLRRRWHDSERGPAPPLDPREVQISAWTIRSLQWFLVTWYFLAGLSKLAGGWLETGNGDVLISHVQGRYMNDVSLWALTYWPKWTFAIFQLVTLGFEIGAPLLLLDRRYRPWGMLIGIGMHVAILLLMTKLWFFCVEMIAFYVLLLPVELPAFLRRLAPARSRASPEPEADTPSHV